MSTSCSALSADTAIMQTGGYGVGVMHRYSLGKGTLCVDAGSTTDFVGDAIVNSVNANGWTGVGVDHRITQLGGIDFANARGSLPRHSLEGGETWTIPPGGAVMVGPAPGGRYGQLFVPFVILTAGPHYERNPYPDEGDRLLRNAYTACMELAKDTGLSKVGFPLICAGGRRGKRPLSGLLRIAVEGIRDNSYDGADIHLIAFSWEEQDELVKVADEILGKKQRAHESTM